MGKENKDNFLNKALNEILSINVDKIKHISIRLFTSLIVIGVLAKLVEYVYVNEYVEYLFGSYSVFSTFIVQLTIMITMLSIGYKIMVGMRMK